MKLCTSPGCTKPHQARGLCAHHYRKARYCGKEDLIGIIQPHGPKGSGSVSQKGYAKIGQVEVHRVRAERAFGRPLPAGAIVHHVNGDKANPDADLVICPDQSYHFLIERRTQAFNACGNPDHIKCRYCHEWDDPIKGDMYISPGSTHHRVCRNQHSREERANAV